MNYITTKEWQQANERYHKLMRDGACNDHCVALRDHLRGDRRWNHIEPETINEWCDTLAEYDTEERAAYAVRVLCEAAGVEPGEAA